MCTFRASCCSACLSWAQVPVPLSETGKKGEWDDRTGGYKRVQAVRLELVAGRWWFEVLWNLECPVGISQREICVHFKV